MNEQKKSCICCILLCTLYAVVFDLNVLEICRDTMHISKNEDSVPTTPITDMNGIKSASYPSNGHQTEVSDSDFQYQSRLRDSSVI